MEWLLEEKAIPYSVWMHNVLTVPVLLLASLWSYSTKLSKPSAFTLKLL